jgi:hypothetical protein
VAADSSATGIVDTGVVDTGVVDTSIGPETPTGEDGITVTAGVDREVVEDRTTDDEVMVDLADARSALPLADGLVDAVTGRPTTGATVRGVS